MEKREIKFRAKRLDNGEFVFGHYTQGNESNHYITTPKGSVWEIDPETVGQYTGLKDKNGKEFYYDSDLVELEGYSGLWIAVKDDFDIPCFKRTDDSFELIQFSDYFLTLTRKRTAFEIKGTTFENPELLNN